VRVVTVQRVYSYEGCGGATLGCLGKSVLYRSTVTAECRHGNHFHSEIGSWNILYYRW